jgi:lysyl-tRNA synthetase class I
MDKSEWWKEDNLETRVEKIENWMDKYAAFVEDLCSIVEARLEKEKGVNAMEDHLNDLDDTQEEIESA